LIEFASNGWVRVRKIKLEHGCCCERVREYTRTPQPSEKGGRRRRDDLSPVF
jgi:hypothetical protein